MKDKKSIAIIEIDNELVSKLIKEKFLCGEVEFIKIKTTSEIIILNEIYDKFVGSPFYRNVIQMTYFRLGMLYGESKLIEETLKTLGKK